MESINSFKGYGKVDPLEEAAFRRKNRRRLIILSVSLILLAVLIIGVVAGTVANSRKSNGSGEARPSTSKSAAIKSICGVTQHPDSCFASLENASSADPETVFRLSLTVVMDSLERLSSLPEEYANKTDEPLVKAALKVCGAVLDDAVSSLNDSIASVSTGGDRANEDKVISSVVNDVKTWLSTVVTDQETCLDALLEANASFASEIRHLMKNSTEFASNSLAIASKILGILGNFKFPIHRKLLAEPTDFPAWSEAGDRRLLQETAPQPNVTVAADGSGDVRTITEAVNLIPKKSESRFVIHVKAGTYVENVVLDKSRWNVMMYGDGKSATIISGDKNFIDGTPTFETATFVVAGKGFIARDITFRNTAGAAKHQAVAFRSGSDESILYRCSFDAYQDTLYAHSNRQFYRECDITGTIDFIFGNAAVVFQNCAISPRQPLDNQFVTITAQGRKDPNQNTGISIQRCTLSPLDKLTRPTYLGRPWKDFSATVVMESEIGGFLDPRGWISWVASVDPPNSIFYGEYRNTGVGASTSGRVGWAGYRGNMTAADAAKYTVETFIEGAKWLPGKSVVYDST